ncbi:hypothetical protein Bca52824_024214 [Brassica carinata]|uniref:Uncharacterized protein n=1 Tax=Brassica carinata TaxID=52824 RepID=A0A8X8AWH9_BRACI|nr:hypothetical protein Bca52824_024214 [Brassica carinata]
MYRWQKLKNLGWQGCVGEYRGAKGTLKVWPQKLQQRMAAISVTCPSPKWETRGDVTTFKQSLT